MLRRWSWLLLVVGCSADPVDDGDDTSSSIKDTGEEQLGPCEGTGKADVVLGSGGRVDFVGFDEGDELALPNVHTRARCGGPGAHPASQQGYGRVKLLHLPMACILQASNFSTFSHL